MPPLISTVFRWNRYDFKRKQALFILTKKQTLCLWVWLRQFLEDNRNRFLILGAGLCLMSGYKAAELPHGGQSHFIFILTQRTMPEITYSFLFGGLFVGLGLLGYALKSASNADRTRR